MGLVAEISSRYSKRDVHKVLRELGYYWKYQKQAEAMPIQRILERLPRQTLVRVLGKLSGRKVY